jgi:hypothetical protein
MNAICSRSAVLKRLLFVLFLLCMSTCAKADDIIYSQPAQTPVSNLGGIYFHSASESVADIFTLSQGATLSSIQWQGSYDGSIFKSDFPAADASSFVLLLATCTDPSCSGDFFVPGYPLEVTPSMANETFIGNSTANVDGAFAVHASNYTYDVNLASPQHLASGTYEFSIFPELPIPTGDENGWSWDAGTGGDGVSRILNSALPPNDFDLAFTFLGTNDSTTPTPEPSSSLLIGIGLIGMFTLAGGARSRRLVGEQ